MNPHRTAPGLALALAAALAAPAHADVATAAFNSVPSGDPFWAYSTYRTLQDAAGRFTLAIDSDANNLSTRNFLSCPTSNPDYFCSATNGGTPPGSPNDLTAAQSSSFFAARFPTTTGDAKASADLSDGTLRASAISNGLNSQAFARLDDTLNFSIAGATASTLTQIGVSFVLDGTLDARSAGIASVSSVLGFGSAQAILDYAQSPDLFSRQIASGWDSYSWNAVDPSHTVFTGTYSLLGASAELGIAQFLKVESANGGIADYGSTSHLSLILPANVSFTSDSGVFLSANNVAPVPEPGTWALMAAGLSALWLRRRRRAD